MDINQFVAVTKALSDQHRVRALYALKNGELCVCRIIALLGLAPSTVSKHMSVLKHAGLVESRKQERWIYYRLAGSREGAGMCCSSLKWVFSALSGDGALEKDKKKLLYICLQSAESLCKKMVKKQKGKNR